MANDTLIDSRRKYKEVGNYRLSCTWKIRKTHIKYMTRNKRDIIWVIWYKINVMT